jgi:hypothetical protein
MCGNARTQKKEKGERMKDKMRENDESLFFCGFATSQSGKAMLFRHVPTDLRGYAADWRHSRGK